jgi:4-hydroxybenzoate polyprenyltransferase
VYRVFIKFVRWYGRLAASTAAGFIAAMALCLVGGRLTGDRDGIATGLLVLLAISLWLAVAVVSYRFLKPDHAEDD